MERYTEGPDRISHAFRTSGGARAAAGLGLLLLCACLLSASSRSGPPSGVRPAAIAGDDQPIVTVRTLAATHRSPLPAVRGRESRQASTAANTASLPAA